MYLDNNVFQDLWKKKKEIFSKKAELVERFDKVKDKIDLLSKEKINQFEIKAFGPNDDGVVTSSGSGSMNNLCLNNKKLDDKYKGYNYDRAKDIWYLCGSASTEEYILDARYRIISNNYKYDDYNGNLKSYGAGEAPRTVANFASNNYYFQFAKFLQESRNNNPTYEELINASKIVMTWKDSKDLDGKSDNEKFNSSKELLKYRFPLKFLWMWAKKDAVLHPFSLMAFREFISSEFGKSILSELKNDDNIKNIVVSNTTFDKIDVSKLPEEVTNCKFDSFIKIWIEFSNKVKNIVVKNNDNIDINMIISDISKIISVIMVEDIDMKSIEELLEVSKQIILYGPPGTGKTYSAMKAALKFIQDNQAVNVALTDNEFEEKYRFIKYFPNKSASSQGNEGNKEYKHNHGLYEIIQFHPNYTYQDFIGGIFPKIDGNEADKVKYELREGIFKKFCDEAAKATNSNNKFIFIIDEINRANLSEVFGELLYALEYRNKPISIPYFGEFKIPENVYIIGTMNNVDKSLVTFDLALRRRFGFYAFKPDMSTLQTKLKDITNVNSFFERCAALNRAIINTPNDNEKNDQKFKDSALALDENYQVGHEYFLKIKYFINNGEIKPHHLQKLWEYYIEPLLEEYLGMSLESKEIKKKLSKLKEAFIAPLN